MNPQHLVIFAKRPLSGYAKTRLGAGIGAEPAAGVYARLLYTYLVDLAHDDLPDTTIELAVAAPEDVAYFRHAFPEFVVRPQNPGDLGARLAYGFRRAFAEGAASVMITSSDSPGLTGDLVRQGFAALQAPPTDGRLPGVIGPAADGGYYLIGMQAPGADLFADIAWSTPDVLTQTLARAERLKVRFHRLPELLDVDTRADYETWLAAQRLKPPHSAVEEK